jgi:hypothetical protein
VNTNPGAQISRGGKVRRFGHGSKTLERRSRSRSITDEPVQAEPSHIINGRIAA